MPLNTSKVAPILSGLYVCLSSADSILEEIMGINSFLDEDHFDLADKEYDQECENITKLMLAAGMLHKALVEASGLSYLEDDDVYLNLIKPLNTDDLFKLSFQECE